MGVGENVVVAIAGAQAARGQEEIRPAHGIGQGHDIQAARSQGIAVGHDLDFADLAPADGGAGHAGNALQLWLDRVVCQIVKLFLVEQVARNRDRDDGNTGYVELDDKGLLDAGRQGVENLGDTLGHLELGVVQIGPVGEPHADERHALLGRAFHLVHAGRSADRAFDGLGNRLLDVLRPRAGIEGGDADDRDGDVREEVH